MPNGRPFCRPFSSPRSPQHPSSFPPPFFHLALLLARRSRPCRDFRLVFGVQRLLIFIRIIGTTNGDGESRLNVEVVGVEEDIRNATNGQRDTLSAVQHDVGDDVGDSLVTIGRGVGGVGVAKELVSRGGEDRSGLDANDGFFVMTDCQGNYGFEA